MKIDDLENELRDLKFMHLSASELAAYDDQPRDQIGRARMEAHLKQCFICARQLELLREENEALSQHRPTANDEAFVERMLEQTRLRPTPSATGPAEIAQAVPWRERLAASLQQLVANWQIAFKPVRSARPVQAVWRWQSEDGGLRARVTMEENNDMIVHFSSNEMALAGTRLHFQLGSLSQEITLQRISESEVAAQVAIPVRYRRSNTITDISIQIV